MVERKMTVVIPEPLYRDIQARRPAGVVEFVQQAVAEKLEADEGHKRAMEFLNDRLREFEQRYGMSSAEFYARWLDGSFRELDIWEGHVDLWVTYYQYTLEADSTRFEVEVRG